MQPLFNLSHPLAIGRGSAAFFQMPSWSISAGERWAILGANGCGKTTLLETLLGWLPSLSSPKLAMMSSATYLPQATGEAPRLSVCEVVELGALANGPSVKATPHALQALDLLCIDTLASERYDQLSGGQQQLVRIARCLARSLSDDSALLILDEPTASLDPTASAVIMRTLRRQTERGGALVFTTHYPHEARAYATHALLIRRGEVARLGLANEVLSHANLEWLYGTRLIEQATVVATG